MVSGWINRLKAPLRSQYVMGAVLAVLFVALWWAWTFFPRVQLLGLAMAAGTTILLVLEYPVAGMVLGLFLSQAVSVHIPNNSLSAVILLVFCTLGLRKLILGDLTWRINPVMRWSILFFSWYMLSGLWAGQYDYFLPLDAIKMIVVMMVISEVITTRAQFRWLIVGGLLGVILTSVTVISSAQEFFSAELMKSYGLAGEIEHARFGIGEAEVNSMALAMVPFVAMGFALARTRLPVLVRIVGAAGAAIGTAGVLLTLSRGAMLGLMLITLIIGFAERHRLRLLIGLLLIVFVMLAFLPINLFGRLETLSNPGGDGSFKQRASLLFSALAVGADYFPLGVGAGNFRAHSTDYSNDIWSGMIAHNTYAEVWAELGILGVVLFLAILAAAWWELRGPRHRVDPDNFDQTMTVCLRAGMAALTLAFATLSAATYYPFWIIIALISLRRDILRSETPDQALPEGADGRLPG